MEYAGDPRNDIPRLDQYLKIGMSINRTVYTINRTDYISGINITIYINDTINRTVYIHDTINRTVYISGTINRKCSRF